MTWQLTLKQIPAVMVDSHKSYPWLIAMLKWLLVNIWFKLYLNLVGAVYIVKEQILSRPRRLPDYPDQKGKTVVITGGGRGIGEHAVRKMVRLGARVIMGCRSPEIVMKKFEDLTNEESVIGSVEVYYLDLMSLGSVNSFAKQVIALQTPVHILINNAGIMFGTRKETEDGFESQLATNYLGHFLLTHILLPVLVKSGTKDSPARIINVSSCAHFVGSWLDFSDLQLNKLYSPEKAYGNSKAAQIMFTGVLARVLEDRQVPVISTSLHPGVVHTDLYAHVGWVKIFSWVAWLIMKTPEQGGDTLVYAALDESVDKETLFMENCRSASTSNFTSTADTQQKMWEVTCSLLEIQHFGKDD